MNECYAYLSVDKKIDFSWLFATQMRHYLKRVDLLPYKSSPQLEVDFSQVKRIVSTENKYPNHDRACARVQYTVPFTSDVYLEDRGQFYEVEKGACLLTIFYDWRCTDKRKSDARVRDEQYKFLSSTSNETFIKLATAALAERNEQIKLNDVRRWEYEARGITINPDYPPEYEKLRAQVDELNQKINAIFHKAHKSKCETLIRVVRDSKEIYPPAKEVIIKEIERRDLSAQNLSYNSRGVL